MKKLVLLVVAIFLSACGTVPPLSDRASKVRVVSNSPHIKECRYISQIRANGTVGFLWSDSKIKESSLINLKEEAAKIGANAIEILQAETRSYVGEAYKCNWVN